MNKVIQMKTVKADRAADNSEQVADWFESYRTALLSYARRLLPSHLNPEDVVQEVYTRILEHKNIQMIENPRAYVMTIARNTIIDMRNKQKGITTVTDDSERNDVSESFVSMNYGELSLAIEKAMEDLPEKSRKIFIMRHYKGLKTPEIASVMNISERMVQKYLSKALAHFYKRVL